MNSGGRPWAQASLSPFRNRIIGVALMVSTCAIALLLIISWRQPGSGSWRLGETWFAFGNTILTTILGIGVLTLLWEYALRKSYAESLHHYISLKGSLVATGLASVNSRQDAAEDDVPGVLRGAREIRCATRKPLEWTSKYFYSVIFAAGRHEVHLELLVPDVEGDSLLATAKALHLTRDQLKANVQQAEETIQTIWSQAPIHPGSTISVVTVDGPVFDMMTIDGDAVLEIATSIGHSAARETIVFWFDRQGHVAEWVTKQFNDALVGAALWAAPKGSKSHFRSSL